MCVIVKTRCFYSFTFQNQKIQHTITKKNWLLNSLKVSWCTIWVGDTRNFHNSFFVKNYYLKLSFFQVLQSALLKKKKKKNLLRKDTSYLKIAWHSKRQKKNIEKGERKTKNEKQSNSNNKYFILLLFHIGKFIFH